jgi:hypothetical protein
MSGALQFSMVFFFIQQAQTVIGDWIVDWFHWADIGEWLIASDWSPTAQQILSYLPRLLPSFREDPGGHQAAAKARKRIDYEWHRADDDGNGACGECHTSTADKKDSGIIMQEQSCRD